MIHLSSRKKDRKIAKGVVSFTHGQNIICNQTQLDDIAHEQTIICSQLLAGHVIGFRSMKRKKNLRGMIIKLIGRGWAKYRYLSVQVANRSIICQSRRLGQIIDLRDTGKSPCFAITESNNCFIFHCSPSLFLNYLESDLCHRQARAIARRRKAWFHYAWAEYYLQPYSKPNTVGRQTIICRQLFAGHLIGSRPMKRRKICIEL